MAWRALSSKEHELSYLMLEGVHVIIAGVRVLVPIKKTFGTLERIMSLTATSHL